MDRAPILLDGNEAAASVAYRLNEVIAIYPITPSSPMGEARGEGYRLRGRPSTLSAIKLRMSCGLIGAMRGIRDSRK